MSGPFSSTNVENKYLLKQSSFRWGIYNFFRHILVSNGNAWNDDEKSRLWSRSDAIAKRRTRSYSKAKPFTYEEVVQQSGAAKIGDNYRTVQYIVYL